MKFTVKAALAAAVFTFASPAFAQASGSGTGTGARATSGTEVGVPDTYDSTTTKRMPAKKSGKSVDRSDQNIPKYDRADPAGADSTTNSDSGRGN